MGTTAHGLRSGFVDQTLEPLHRSRSSEDEMATTPRRDEFCLSQRSQADTVDECDAPEVRLDCARARDGLQECVPELCGSCQVDLSRHPHEADVGALLAEETHVHARHCLRRTEGGRWGETTIL